MDLKTQKLLASVITDQQKNKVSPYMTKGEVISITDDTIYVKMEGSNISTPVKASSVSVNVGDIVDLSVSHNDTHITGNRTVVAASSKEVERVSSSCEDSKNMIDMIGNTISMQNNDISMIGNKMNIQGSTIETLNSTIKAQESTIEIHDSDIKILNSAFVIKNGKLTGISEIVTGILKSDYVTTDFLNAKVGWIEDGKIKQGAIGTVEIADESVTTAKIKDLSADVITTGTLKTECLILTTDEVDPETGEKKIALITALNAKAEAGEGNILNGAVIADNTIEAAKIIVVDLNAFGATIGNFGI